VSWSPISTSEQRFDTINQYDSNCFVDISYFDWQFDGLVDGITAYERVRITLSIESSEIFNWNGTCVWDTVDIQIEGGGTPPNWGKQFATTVTQIAPGQWEFEADIVAEFGSAIPLTYLRAFATTQTSPATVIVTGFEGFTPPPPAPSFNPIGEPRVDYRNVACQDHTHVMIYSAGGLTNTTLLQAPNYAIMVGVGGGIVVTDMSGGYWDTGLNTATDNVFFVQVVSDNAKASIPLPPAQVQIGRLRFVCWGMSSLTPAADFYSTIPNTPSLIGTLSVGGQLAISDSYSLWANDKLDLNGLSNALAATLNVTVTPNVPPAFGAFAADPGVRVLLRVSPGPQRSGFVNGSRVILTDDSTPIIAKERLPLQYDIRGVPIQADYPRDQLVTPPGVLTGGRGSLIVPGEDSVDTWRRNSAVPSPGGTVFDTLTAMIDRIPNTPRLVGSSLGTSDFTIGLWQAPDPIGSALRPIGYVPLMTCFRFAPETTDIRVYAKLVGGFEIYALRGTAPNRFSYIVFNVCDSETQGTAMMRFAFTLPPDPGQGGRNHVAITRKNGRFYAFLNGKKGRMTDFVLSPSQEGNFIPSEEEIVLGNLGRLYIGTRITEVRGRPKLSDVGFRTGAGAVFNDIEIVAGIAVYDATFDTFTLLTTL